jgi:tetratricopeptide (TPR) repeat protein
MNTNNKSLKEIFSEALQFYQAKDLKSAEVLCSKILNINPDHFDSIILLSNINAINKNFDKARKLLQKGVSIQPQNPTILNNLGTAYKALGKIQESISYYEKVLEFNPDHTNANYNLGIIYYELKKLNESKKYLEKTIKVQPNYASAHFTLGNLLSELKHYEKAKACYEKSIELRPTFPSAHNNLGLIFRLIGKYKESIECYKKAIEINPNHASAYNNLGRSYTELGKLNEAADAHQMAIKIEPENLYQYFYLSELNSDFLNKIDEIKIGTIIKKKSSKMNLAFGNFLLAKHERRKKNHKKEFEFLIKAHSNYFDTKKEKFELGVKYCFEDVPKVSNFAVINTSNNKFKNEINPIFIVGVPRCGSTLIEKILGSGKQPICMGEEIAVLENFINKKILENKDINLGKVDEIRSELTNQYKEKNLVKKENKNIFTDKSLNNFFYLNLIKSIFPNAKVINCKRNYLSSIMSILQNNLTELAWAHNVENIFKYFDIYLDTIEKFKTINSKFIYDLEFEKFTNNPEIESKKLMNFCELEWDEKCLQFYKRKDIVSKTTSYLQIRKPIYKHPSEKYLPYREFLKSVGKKYSWFK